MKDQVRFNAEKDPNYEPYCMRCTTMRRMRKVAPFLWECRAGCGAVGDARLPEEVEAQKLVQSKVPT